MVTLYRAAKDDYVDTGYSFTTSRATAEAYRANPGFGGGTLYTAEIADDAAVLDLTGYTARALAREYGITDPGAIGVDEWVPREPDLMDAIRAAGYLWVTVRESFPENSPPTWIWVGEFADGEPELAEVAG